MDSKLESQKKLIAQLKALIENPDEKKYLDFLDQNHEADIADALGELPKDNQHQFFRHVDPKFAVEVLEEMTLVQQVELLTHFKTSIAATYIEEMEPDDAADVMEEIQESDKKKASEIIHALSSEEASELKELLAYPEDSAGSIMTTDFLAIPENLTVGESISEIRKQNPPDSEASFYTFILDQNKKLVGYTTLRNILMTDPKEKIRNIRNDYPIKVHVNEDQEDVAKIFQKYDLIALPVVNSDNVLVGLITVDDIVDVVVEEATEDMYKLSGTYDIDKHKFMSGKLFPALISRSPWLLLTVASGMMSSFLITSFSSLYNNPHYTLGLCLSFVPMLTGVSGNAGNQSGTIIVRGIATGLVNPNQSTKSILKEIRVGFFVGLLVSLCVYAFNSLFTSYNPLFILLVSFSLLCNVVIAVLIGASLPLFFEKINIDPAVASTPFIAATLDITGQLVYFTILLKLLSLTHL